MGMAAQTDADGGDAWVGGRLETAIPPPYLRSSHPVAFIPQDMTAHLIVIQKMTALGPRPHREKAPNFGN